MWMAIGLIGLFGIFVCIIWLVIRFIGRKSLIPTVIGMLSCAILCFGGVGIGAAIEGAETENNTNEPQKPVQVANVKNEEPEEQLPISEPEENEPEEPKQDEENKGDSQDQPPPVAAQPEPKLGPEPVPESKPESKPTPSPAPDSTPASEPILTPKDNSTSSNSGSGSSGNKGGSSGGKSGSSGGSSGEWGDESTTNEITGSLSRAAYWTPNGKSYHFSETCPSLSRSRDIKSGTLQDALNAGKTDPCNNCANGS